jgi:predicted dehydrogenase
VTHLPDLRVGLVGYGLAGASFHAPLIATTPGLRLAAVVTRDDGRRRQAAADHPGVRLVDDADALWGGGAPAVDVVVVASPNRTHVPLARRALDAGLAVVVDKPLAATTREARALVAHAAALGRPLTVFQNRRWDGDFLTIRRLLAEGALGAVHRFESRFERWRPTPKPGWRERGDAEEAGGILFDLGSHLIDQARVLFGPVRQVYAEVDRRRPRVEVDDDSFVALTHASGVRSHLWMSAVAAGPAPRLRVLGSAGSYTKHGLDVQEAALRAGGRPGGADWGTEPRAAWGLLATGDGERAVATERGDYGGFYAALVAALRGGAPLPVDPIDAVEGLAVIQAARRSALAGQVVAPEAPSDA